MIVYVETLPPSTFSFSRIILSEKSATFPDHALGTLLENVRDVLGTEQTPHILYRPSTASVSIDQKREGKTIDTFGRYRQPRTGVPFACREVPDITLAQAQAAVLETIEPDDPLAFERLRELDGVGHCTVSVARRR